MAPFFIAHPEVPTNETFAMSYLMKALMEQHHPATSASEKHVGTERGVE